MIKNLLKSLQNYREEAEEGTENLPKWVLYWEGDHLRREPINIGKAFFEEYRLNILERYRENLRSLRPGKML